MKKFMMTTLFGGALFLIPLVFLTWILGKGFTLMLSVAKPIASLLPFDSVAGIGLVSFLALVLMIVVCLITGLIARAKFASAIYKKSDSVIAALVPNYTWTKVILKNLSGHEESDEFKPVRVRLDDQTQLGFEMERGSDGRVVVFFPGAPDAQSGAVGYLDAGRVEPLDTNLLAVNRVLRQMGRGAAVLFTQDT